MKMFVYPEMMVHVSMCTHKLPTSVLVASDNDAHLNAELARHKDSTVINVGGSDLLESFRNVAEKSVDVVMVDALTSDAVVIAHISRILKDDGLVVMKHPSLDDVNANKPLMEALGNYFKIIMPYRLEDGSTLLLSSKEYHPTADVILQRTDLLEGHQYYNCDIHPSAFAMPQYIRENYRGLARN